MIKERSGLCQRKTAMLIRDGFKVNHKRVEHICREQGLKVAKN
jgi:hypothetical protein